MEHTCEELQAYTLCQSKERIPRLSDLLQMVDGRVPLIVEIKAETADVSGCVAIDKLLRAYRGAYCIESFNPMVLWWFRRHHGEVVRGQLSSNFRKDGEYWNVLYFAMTHLLFNFLTKPDFIAYNHKFSEEPAEGSVSIFTGIRPLPGRSAVKKICRRLRASTMCLFLTAFFRQVPGDCNVLAFLGKVVAFRTLI